MRRPPGWGAVAVHRLAYAAGRWFSLMSAMSSFRLFSFRTSLPARSAPVLVACAALLVLGGCDRAAQKASSQVAVKVNDDEISVHQVDVLLSRQPTVPADQADAQTRRLVDTLVEEELAAQAARKQGLDRDPRVVQAVEAAKREVLARAYQDSLADQAVQPSTDEIERYYESQPALFAQRKLYTVQELAAEAGEEQLAALKPKIEAASGAEAAGDVLRAAGLRYTSRQLTLPAEAVPLPMLPTLAALEVGKSLVLPGPGGVRVVTLLQSQPATVDRKTASPAIQQYLLRERKRQIVLQGMKSIRDTAHIEYRGRFTPPSAAASSASATTP